MTESLHFSWHNQLLDWENCLLETSSTPFISTTLFFCIEFHSISYDDTHRTSKVLKEINSSPVEKSLPAGPLPAREGHFWWWLLIFERCEPWCSLSASSVLANVLNGMEWSVFCKFNKQREKLFFQLYQTRPDQTHTVLINDRSELDSPLGVSRW